MFVLSYDFLIHLHTHSKTYDNGGHFPVWGTCLGFELMNVLQNGDNSSVITSVSAKDINLRLKFTPGAAMAS